MVRNPRPTAERTGEIRGRIGLACGWLAAVAAGFACGEPPPPEEEYAVEPGGAAAVSEPRHCLDRNPLRNAYFGDLHVHTSISSDAWMFDVRVGPDGAYRYAFGEAIYLPPNGPDGRGTRPVRIDRPLDFAAVTDHAEFMGEGPLCVNADSPVYDADLCRAYRKGESRDRTLAKHIFSPIAWRNDEVCGEDGERCRVAARGTWQSTIAAAEQWNDTSERCVRTTFIGYEYSSHRLGSNLHRNVIFRNDIVPGLPVSYIEAPREWELWRMLRQGCIDTGTGCDVLAIPHNSNISNGRMFAVDYPGAGGDREQAERARLRIQMEPVVEVMQHKGDSECRNGAPGVLNSEDELCDFEKFEDAAFLSTSGTSDPGECYDGPLADWVPHKGPNCIDRLSYVRYALIEGLNEEERIGVNPFKFGLVASTDTHNALAGGVQERSYPGHLGKGDATRQQRVSRSREIPGNTSNNPGGLIGVWAEQNERDSLFEAIRRKEVFGTSGPRIRPRLFASWEFDAALCDGPNPVGAADAAGVPMGGDLPVRAGEASPHFVVMASADPGTREAPGTPLQRLQIVKGWVDADGNRREQVFDVAGTKDDGADVDLATCEPRGRGHMQLCSVWRDPDFDSERRAVYYLRAVENPSCRYSTWQCLSLRGADRPADCDDPAVPKLIQERAWSSPIWYTP